MSLFKDFGKASKDLLSKNYTFDKNKIEFAAKDSDTSFEGEWTSAGSSKLEGEAKIGAKTAANVEFLSDGKVTGTLKFKEIFPGALLKTKFSTANKLFLGLEYTRDSATFTAEGDHDLKKSATELNFSALFKPYTNVLLGGSLQLGADATGAGINKYDIGVGYAQDKKYELTVNITEEVKKSLPAQLQVNYIHYLDSLWTYSAKFSRAVVDNAKPAVELGGTYQLSSLSKVGAKISHTGLLGLYLVSRPDPNVTLTQSVQLDVTDNSTAHKVGFGVKFSK